MSFSTQITCFEGEVKVGPESLTEFETKKLLKLNYKHECKGAGHLVTDIISKMDVHLSSSSHKCVETVSNPTKQITVEQPIAAVDNEIN